MNSEATLSAAIDKLPDPHRDVMRLHLRGKQSADEIAQRLGIQVAEIEQMLYEGNLKLQRLLNMTSPHLKIVPKP